MKTRLLKVVLVLVIAGLMLTLSACGSQEDTIKIGGAFPMTGMAAYDGKQMEAGAKMAIEEINEAGGVLGKPLELIIYDVEDVSPEKFTAAASYLVLEKGVDMLHSAWNAIGPDFTAFAKYDVPYLTDGSVTTEKMVLDDKEKYWNCVQLGTGEQNCAKTIFTAMTELPYEYPNNKIAILVGNYEWDINMGNEFRSLADENGWEVVVDELVEYGTREWRPIITKLKAENPSIIFIEILDQMDLVTFMRDFLQEPTDSLISVCYSVAVAELRRLGESDVDWVSGFHMPCAIASGEKGAQWEKKFEDQFGWEPPGGVPPLINYDLIYYWADAVERVGDPKDYRAVVQAMVDNPYQGVAGEYKINPDSLMVEPGPNFPGCYPTQIQDGKVVLWQEEEGKEYMLPKWIKEPWKKKN